MRRVVLVLLAFTTLATACAEERPVLDDSAAREVDQVGVGAGPAADAEVPEARVTVRLAVPAEWSTDPADAGPAALSTRLIADLLYEGLTRLDSEGLPQAALAERWFASDDRLTWTFVLAADAVDGAGKPITARDVKRSLERVAARGPADQAAGALTAVKGWSDRMKGTTGGVAGISATDATTLVIRLDAPFELLTDVLAAPAFGITGEDSAGDLRTTGAFAATEDPAILTAVDPENPVAAIELVTDPAGPVAVMANEDADWAVLAPGDSSAALPGDIIRQPLDLEVAIVARMRNKQARLAVLGVLEPLQLADAVPGLTPQVGPESRAAGAGAPPAVLVDVPVGPLEPVASAAVAQLEDAGIEVLAVPNGAAEFAARVEAGEATIFPVILAGGVGLDGSVLRFATPGGIDDVFGPESQARSELAAAVRAERDVAQRGRFAEALRQTLVDDGYLLPIGRFEVRVALGTRLDGLRHRSDGTLDLSEVRLAG